MDGREIDFGRAAGNTELGCVAVMGRRMSRRQEGFRGHTAIVQAIAAHLAALEQGDAGAHLDRTGRHGQSAGPGTDQTYIDVVNFAHDWNTKARGGEESDFQDSSGRLFFA